VQRAKNTKPRMDNKPKTGYSGVCDDKGKSKNIIPGPLQNSAHYKYV